MGSSSAARLCAWVVSSFAIVEKRTGVGAGAMGARITALRAAAQPSRFRRRRTTPFAASSCHDMPSARHQEATLRSRSNVQALPVSSCDQSSKLPSRVLSRPRTSRISPRSTCSAPPSARRASCRSRSELWMKCQCRKELSGCSQSAGSTTYTGSTGPRAAAASSGAWSWMRRSRLNQTTCGCMGSRLSTVAPRLETASSFAWPVHVTLS